MRRVDPLGRSARILAGRCMSSAVFLLFLASSISQVFLPLVHLREVDAKEAQECSCVGHSPSHVEKDRAGSHHDSGSCPVCQVIHSYQPSEGPTLGTLSLAPAAADVSPCELRSPELRGPPLTGSSPRAPPPSL